MRGFGQRFGRAANRIATSGSQTSVGGDQMQAYSKGFARAYNLRWSGFARQVALFLLDFYAATPIGQGNTT